MIEKAKEALFVLSLLVVAVLVLPWVMRGFYLYLNFVFGPFAR